MKSESAPVFTNLKWSSQIETTLKIVLRNNTFFGRGGSGGGGSKTNVSAAEEKRKIVDKFFLSLKS